MINTLQLLVLLLFFMQAFADQSSVDQARYAKEESALQDIFHSLGNDEELQQMLNRGLLEYKKKWQTAQNSPAIADYEKALQLFSQALLGIKSGSGSLIELSQAEKAIEEADKAVSESNPDKKKIENEAKRMLEKAQASF